MPPPVFMGDEIAAAGYRLAGLHAYSCDPASVPALFDKLLAENPPLFLIGESCVAHIGEFRVNAAVSHAQPPVLVVADIFGWTTGDKLPDSIRSVLGVMT